MATACVRGRWTAVSGVLLAGLLVPAWGQEPGAAPAKKDAVKKEAAKKPAAKKAAPSPPAAEGNDVREVVALINEHLAEAWKEKKLTPSRRATDHEFCRRVHLDIIGRIPKPDEIRQFLRDPAPTRRALLIDRLLADEEYAKNWANVWTVWLLTRSGQLEPGRADHHRQMRDWLQRQLAVGLSHKDLVTQLLTATGKTTENGAVNFILAHLGEPTPRGKTAEEGQFDMVPITSRTTRLFLGLQTQCTQCHDHPFNPDRKQKEFWGVNAYFRQVQRRGRPVMNNNRMMTAAELTLTDNADFNKEGLVYFEKRNAALLSSGPAWLDGKTKLDRSASLPRRQELARLVTGSEFFPKAYVNRMWAHFLGRGFTDPVDDFGEHNEPSMPELLDALAEKFAHNGYDPRKLIAWICNSDAYNLSSLANATNDKAEAEPYFSRMLLKAMSPEQLFESLMVATQAEAGQKAESRNKLRDQWMRNLIVNFGDDEGNETTFNGTVVQALLLMNGKEINDVISSRDKGTVALAFVKRKGSPQAVITDLYLAALGRPPSPAELGKVLGILRRAPVRNPDALAPYQDLFWALLNSNEFILNH